MIHLLTLGFFGPGPPRTAAVARPLDMEVVNRLLSEIGDVDAAGKPALDGMPVKTRDGAVVVRWKVGPYRSALAEEFALRLHAETGCAIVDREHSRAIDPDQLEGVSALAGERGRGSVER